MRNLVDVEKTMEVSDFWIYFFAVNFPNAFDCDTEMSLVDMIEEKYSASMDWVHTFTQYEENIFKTSDGYIENPNSFIIHLFNDNVLTIEFHPGDIYYFMNGERLGCTGPHYFIHRIPLAYYNELVSFGRWENKVLLLPMVRISKDEKEGFKNMISELLLKLPFNQEDYSFISNVIAENCLYE